ncbi:MAG TPA: DUF3362 domain-containing protein, partial [Marinagarivorans sp.]
NYKSGKVHTPRNLKQRRFQKALLRFHDQKTWPLLRDSFKEMGREDLIGTGDNALVPPEALQRSRPRKQIAGKLAAARNPSKGGVRGKRPGKRR